MTLQVNQTLLILIGLVSADQDVAAVPFTLDGRHGVIPGELVPGSRIDGDVHAILPRECDQFVTRLAERLTSAVQPVPKVLVYQNNVMRNLSFVDSHDGLQGDLGEILA